MPTTKSLHSHVTLADLLLGETPIGKCGLGRCTALSRLVQDDRSLIKRHASNNHKRWSAGIKWSPLRARIWKKVELLDDKLRKIAIQAKAKGKTFTARIKLAPNEQSPSLVYLAFVQKGNGKVLQSFI